MKLKRVGAENKRCKGKFYSQKSGRNILYNGRMQLKCINELEQWSLVKEFERYSGTVPYEYRGTIRRTHPNFIVTWRDGSVSLIKLVSQGFTDKRLSVMKGLTEFCREKGWGLLFYDGFFHLGRKANGR